jgi:hypothetical protein
MDFYFLHSLADDQQKASETGGASFIAGQHDQATNTYTIDAFHVGNVRSHSLPFPLFSDFSQFTRFLVGFPISLGSILLICF